MSDTEHSRPWPIDGADGCCALTVLRDRNADRIEGAPSPADRPEPRS